MADPKAGSLSPDVITAAARQAVNDDPGAMSYDAQSDPQDLQQKRSKVPLALWLGVLGAGQAADAASTIQALHDPNIHESNGLYGSHPSAGRIIATKAAVGVPLALLAAKLYDKHPKIAEALAGSVGAAGAAAAIHNYGVMNKAGGQ